MARLRQFFHNVVSSYAALAATTIYTFVSVPLALAFLSRDAFGLWALLAQVTSYLTLIDVGMTGAATRLLIDHKDSAEDETYGSLVKTSFLVALVQAGLILAIGFVLAPQGASLLGIQSQYRDIFTTLLLWQTGITAFAFVVRPLSQMLGAHQRLDLINHGQSIQITVALGFLWWFLHRQHGLYSFVYGSAIATLVNALYLLANCLALKLLPRPGSSGKASWTLFKEVFAYGKDLFFVALGTQLIVASQTIIVARCLGLQVAAAWAVGTRVLSLLLQVIWRISDSASVTLAEMIARGERERLRSRYSELVIVSALLGGMAAVIFAACNTLFVEIWTSGKIAWSFTNDLLLGVWMILLTLIHIHCGFVLLTKKIAFMRFVYFAEGCVFVAIALFVLQFGSLPFMIAASVLCSLLFSGAYGTWRVAQYFDLRFGEVAVDWLKPMFHAGLYVLPVALSLHFGLGFLEALPRFILTSLTLGAWSAIVVGRIGLPIPLRREVLLRTPRFVQPFLQRLFAVG